MKRFLVHFTDNISYHKQEDMEGFQIVTAEDEEGNPCQILSKDSFYLVEAETPVDAIVDLAQKINIENSEGEMIPLSKALSDETETEVEKEEKDAEDIELDNEEEVEEEKEKPDLRTSPSYDYFEKTTSQIFKVSCSINRTEEDEVVYELHEITFYVVGEKAILDMTVKIEQEENE